MTDAEELKFKEITSKNYFYVPCLAFASMDECVTANGSGFLVANHELLDDVDDLTSALKAERERSRKFVERLRYVIQQVEMSENARDAFQAIISNYFEASHDK